MNIKSGVRFDIEVGFVFVDTFNRGFYFRMFGSENKVFCKFFVVNSLVIVSEIKVKSCDV